MGVDLKRLIAGYAPTLATMLGGPLAGTAVAAIESALGLTPPPTASVSDRKDTVTQAVETGQMTPETVVALRRADQEHAERLQQMQIDLVKVNADHDAALVAAAAADRASARQANVSSSTQGKLFWLSLALLGATLGVEGWVLFNGYPPQLDAIVVGRVLGLLDAVAMTVVSYWYGSSHGSSIKTALIADKAEAAK